ncbi:MAG: MotA/TolQ/ExbB proton channel family protein [Panacagrimonas sp.]
MTALLHGLSLGGPVLWILILLSIATLTLVIVKVWDFSESKLWRRDFVENALSAWSAGSPDRALALLAGERGPLAELMVAAMSCCRNRTQPEARIREGITQLAVDRLESARSLLRPLEVIAMLAPLLGLLGTVLGMIQVFRRLEQAGDRVDASILSGGLWEALLTTAAGLGVAILALAAFHFLDRQVERLHRAMESALTRIFAGMV